MHQCAEVDAFMKNPIAGANNWSEILEKGKDGSDEEVKKLDERSSQNVEKARSTVIDKIFEKHT